MSYSYEWRRRRPEDLIAAGYECIRCAIPDRPMGMYSSLERAHLDGDSTHDEPANVCVLCRTCHRRLDHAQWLADYRVYLERRRAERIAERDAGRPILQFLEEAS